MEDAEWVLLSEDAQKILSGPKNLDSKAVYTKYSSRYMDFCTDIFPFSEISMIEFMTKMKTVYSDGCIWSVYSCIKNVCQTCRCFKLQQFTRLMCIMKRLTDGYVPVKSNIFSEEQMHEIFKNLDKDNPKELVAKFRITLMYYGLLRQNEVLKIRVMDVTTKEN